MLSSDSKKIKPKFLIDENIREELFEFLKSKEYDIIKAPKGLSDMQLAEISKREERVFITNDTDFTDPSLYPKEKIFGIILLRIPQRKLERLLDTISELLTLRLTLDDFKGHLITLHENESEISLLSTTKEFSK